LKSGENESADLGGFGTSYGPPLDPTDWDNKKLWQKIKWALRL